ncbi:MAG: leucyl aminopeptidase [Planctomycetes bacterium]|nr:leucyl aminopeptidase [Planctomycetota bacterium]
MKILAEAHASASDPLLAVLCFEGEKPQLPSGVSVPARALEDFRGRFRQVLLCYPEGRTKVERVVLVGLGKREKVTAEEARRVSALALSVAKDRGARRFGIVVPPRLLEELEAEVAGRALAEGIGLGAYKFDKHKGSLNGGAGNGNGSTLPERATLYARGAEFERGVEHGVRNADAANFARELGDTPGNYATPTALAAAAKKLAGGRISVRVLEEKDMAKHGMGALLGVAQGSAEDAKLILLHYKPKRRAKEKIAVVGKGLTFDTGGISIKPAASMDEMKYDMCGGAAVLGLFHALREMDLPLEVIGLVPSTENMPGGKAYKPGDVLKACNGTTIEVLNTDAEGRLILCDAIAYAEKTYEPDVMVDLATLTGAVVVALGHEMTGVFGNDDATRDAVCDAGNRAGERCWPLPLWDVHKDQVKSEVADLKNINSPKDGGGSIAGAAFLAHFVRKAKWVHMDIAGTAWGGRERDYLHASGASGMGVRTLVQFLIDRAERQ